MTRKQYLLMILLALVAGLIGGALSSQIIQPVFAEKTPKPQKLVVAEEFRLVDKKGKTIARLENRSGSPFIVLGPNSNSMSMLSDKGFSITDGIAMSSVDKNSFNMRNDRSSVWISSDSKSAYISLIQNDYGVISISSDFTGPQISLVQQGRGTSTLGCTELVTKKREQKSLAPLQA